MQEEKQEASVDIKGTLAKFIKTDEPELSQEEAIMKYGEATEEQEHLKRVKQELLASLDRVKQLEKKIYGREEKVNSKKDFKVSEGGKQITKEKDEVEKKPEKETNEQERE